MPYVLMRKALALPKQIGLPLIGGSVFDSSALTNPRTYLNKAFQSRACNESFPYFEEEDLALALATAKTMQTADVGYVPALIHIAEDREEKSLCFIYDDAGNPRIFFKEASEDAAPFTLACVHMILTTPDHLPTPGLHDVIIVDEYCVIWQISHAELIPEILPIEATLVEACERADLRQLAKLLAERHHPNGQTSLLKTLLEKSPIETAQDRRAKMLGVVLLFMFGEESLYRDEAYDALDIKQPALATFVAFARDLIRNHAFNYDATAKFHNACLEGKAGDAFNMLKLAIQKARERGIVSTPFLNLSTQASNASLASTETNTNSSFGSRDDSVTTSQ